MSETRYSPSLERISILAAAILLAYTLAGFINIPSRELNLQLPGFFLNLEFNIQVIIAILVAGMTASGADWLIRGHPKFIGKNSFQHWLLPALTSWAIGLVLFLQPFGTLRWVVFGIGSTILILVLIAEYYVVDFEDTRQIPAMIGIIAISHALFLMLTIFIRANETRLFISIPTITLAYLLTSLRTSYLRTQKWAFRFILIIALIISQIGAALHYLPLRPITYGLILLGPAYALTSLIGGLLDDNGRSFRQIIIEPIVVLSIVWSVTAIVS